MLRCRLPDRPGALAALAGAIGRAGGDIQAVDVVEHGDGHALDDLVVVTEGAIVSQLLDEVDALGDVELVHVGPSRGHPGDAVTRLAIGIESLLNGAMEPEHGMAALLSGAVRAKSTTVEDAEAAPRADGRTLVLELGSRVLVLRRDYRFTQTERHRAEALISVALEALRVRS
jgi:hypothetical protein